MNIVIVVEPIELNYNIPQDETVEHFLLYFFLWCSDYLSLVSNISVRFFCFYAYSHV